MITTKANVSRISLSLVFLFWVCSAALFFTSCDSTQSEDPPLIAEDHPAWEAYNSDSFEERIMQGTWYPISFPAGEDVVWIHRTADQGNSRIFWFHDAGGELAKVTITAYDIEGNILEGADQTSTVPLELGDERGHVFLKAEREAGSGEHFYISPRRTEGFLLHGETAEVPTGTANRNGRFFEARIDNRVMVRKASYHEATGIQTRQFSFADSTNGAAFLRTHHNNIAEEEDKTLEWGRISVTVMDDDFTTLLSEKARMEDTDSVSNGLGTAQAGGDIYFIIEHRPGHDIAGYALMAR
ncbi:hypothetical protein [Spirochaeta dissipatitropha]